MHRDRLVLCLLYRSCLAEYFPAHIAHMECSQRRLLRACIKRRAQVSLLWRKERQERKLAEIRPAVIVIIIVIDDDSM